MKNLPQDRRRRDAFNRTATAMRREALTYLTPDTRELKRNPRFPLN